MAGKAVIKSPFPDCPAFSALPVNHQKFVLEYLKDYNGTQAAIRAGFGKKRSRITASELVTKSNIQEALSEIVGKLFKGEVATQQEIREFWTQIKRGDIGKVCTWGDGGLSFNSTSEKMPIEHRQLIKKISVKEKTSPKGDFTEVQTSVEIHDPLKASELLARDYGMLKGDEKAGDVNIQVNIINFTEKDLK